MNILEILPIQSVTHNTKEMFAFIIKKLKEMGIDYYVDNGNIYATKNPKSLPLIPAFISHTDTVHDITDEIHVLEVDGKYIGFNRYKMGLTGIGGDDKVGIYYCFRALEELDAVKVAFFRDEEIGCVGSQSADMDFFEDVSMIFQGDRKGNKDFVTDIYNVPLSDDKFQRKIKKVVESYNYEFNDNGGLTDVMQLRENGFNRPVANISCGYYNPHCPDEYIVIADMENGLHMLLEIAKKFGHKSFDMPKVERYSGYAYGSAYGYEDYLRDDRCIGDYRFVDDIDNYVHKDDTYYLDDMDCYVILDPDNYRTIDDDWETMFDFYKISFIDGNEMVEKFDAFSTESEVVHQLISDGWASYEEEIGTIEQITYAEYMENGGY